MASQIAQFRLPQEKPSPGGEPPPDARITSWKEIAQFFGRDVRTVKRWEKSRNLPVHRLPGVRGGVYAYLHELQEWQRTAAQEQASPAGTLLTFADDDEEEDDAAPEAFVTTDVIPAPQQRQSRRLWYAAACLVLIAFVAAGTAAWRSRVGALPAGLRNPPSPEARELYLKGRYYWDKRTPQDLNTALGYFQQAVARDPKFGAGYASIADTDYLLREFGTLPDAQAFPAAIMAAKQALSLEPGLAEAHRAYAFGLFYWTWDRVLAEQEFRRAIALAPGDAQTHLWFANTLAASNRMPEAMVEMSRARELQPSSKAVLADRALLLFEMGKAQEGTEALEDMQKDDPSFVTARRYLANLYLSQKRYQDSVDERTKIAELTRLPADKLMLAAADRGWKDHDAEALLNSIADAQVQLYRQQMGPAYEAAAALARAGRDSEAMHYLELSYASHEPALTPLDHIAEFAAMRGSGEFQDLVARTQRPYQEAAAPGTALAAAPGGSH